MIYLLHGEFDKTKENLFLLLKKYNDSSMVEIEISDKTIPLFESSIFSTDVFGDIPLVVANISGIKKETEIKVLELLEKIPEPLNLIFYTSFELTPKNSFLVGLSKFKPQVVFSKSENKWKIFEFLDALFAQNRKRAYKTLPLDADAFYVISMIQMQLRNILLILTKSPLSNKISPTQKSKISRYLSKFDLTITLNLYSYYYKLEKDLKTGNVAPEIALSFAIEKVLQSEKIS